MPLRVPQEFLEDALATWERLRRWTDLNNYLRVLRSSPFYRYSTSERDPYSLRLARRVAEVMDSLTARADLPVDEDVTPRGALLALASDVRLAFSPLPAVHSYEMEATCVSPQEFPSSKINPAAVNKNGNSATRTVDAVSSEGSVPLDDWNTAIMNRSVPGTMIMEGLHVLTCPSVQLRIELAIARLRERVKEELVGGVNWEAFPHTPNELQALRTTTMLLDDFEALYRRLLVTFPCARAMGSPHVPVALLPLAYEQYYQLGDWVLETKITSRTEPGAWVQSFEPRKMQFTLLRPSKKSHWGLRFNQNGKLVGLSAVVRSATIAGDKLHQFMQTSKGGLSPIACNLKKTDFDNLDSTQAAEKLDALTPTQKRLFIKVESLSDSTPTVEQLAFYATQPEEPQPQQKQEFQNLPVATLVLHRDHYSVSWDLAITRNLVVMSFPSSILSPEANAFFAQYPARVRIFGINGVEMVSAAQVEALSSTVNTIVLDLQIIPPSSSLLTPKDMDRKEERAPPAASQVNSSVKKEQWGSGRPGSEDVAILESCGRHPQAAPSEAVVASTKNPLLAKVEDRQSKPNSGLRGKKEKTLIGDESPMDPPREIVSNATVASPAQEQECTTPSRPVAKEAPKRAGRSGVNVQKVLEETVLRDIHRSTLLEEPLVPISPVDFKTSKELHVPNAKEEAADTADTPNRRPCTGDHVVKSTPVAAVLCDDFTPSLDADGPEERVPKAEANEAAPPPTSSQAEEREQENQQPPVELPGAAAVTAGPLKFPNDVTLNLLTLDEMFLSRQSAEKKWGLSMERVGQDASRTIRVVGLPLVMDPKQLQHPFHKLFSSHKGGWNIMSVNGTPATRLPEVMDIMKHALHMQIKFHRRW
ncbi:hypothetical protein MOQ_000654 [Trypanosoma cruzi marinkellei]|uniref:Uncharacterized protein n=1 Tax=Trypanosoma cruzi marinkellei TaxID=85056 RepID=K2PDZ2_TRYCR|nr:hypothetical protein MOQ_000654 [Trypanosoma cruzi marinkellei]